MKKQIKRLSLREMKAKATKADKQHLNKVTSAVRGGLGTDGEAYWDEI